VEGGGEVGREGGWDCFEVKSIFLGDWEGWDGGGGAGGALPNIFFMKFFILIMGQKMKSRGLRRVVRPRLDRELA
jgi:hypothetical protein